MSKGRKGVMYLLCSEKGELCGPAERCGAGVERNRRKRLEIQAFREASIN